MKVIITAGGTGGHIYPALAIINKIMEKEPTSEILYIGTTDRMESKLIPELKIPYLGLEMKGIDRKNLLNNIKIYITYRKALKEAHKAVLKFTPDIVIGVGGYVTVPVLIAAHKAKVKTLIHEQNSIPGVANKKLSSFVDRVCVSLPDTVHNFGGTNVVYTGNPRSEEIMSVEPANKREYGLSENAKLVVIVMGSLGSTTMTEKLKELILSFKGKKYQVLIVTGKDYYGQYADIETPNNVRVVPYLNNFINLLKIADLVISRAGASTIAEITAIGLPSILVPSPYVTHNHQMMNAKELEKIGACSIIEESNFSSETIIPEIDRILDNPKVYKEMKMQAESLGITDSATKIYNEIKKLIQNENTD